MFQLHVVRNFAKLGDPGGLANLVQIQTDSYQRFLQSDLEPTKRKTIGLEVMLREVFPIASYDGNMLLEYLYYELGKPRYTPDECRQLRLTYGMPFRIRVRLTGKAIKEPAEDTIYVGELPIMIGGGEFIINGAERVIVSQLHRSPGVDFVVQTQEGDRPLHACRIIPERGSWIELNVTRKDIVAVRIDQSGKIPATTFLRALDAAFGTDAQVVGQFHEPRTVRVGSLKPDYYAAANIIHPDDPEQVIVKAGTQIADRATEITAAKIKQVEIIDKVSDPLILNTLAEDQAKSHEEALLKIYARLRPGNPPQLDKAKKLFKEKFFDENRYRLGRVGRFRLNRKFNQDVPETEMVLRPADFLNSLKYLVMLRSGDVKYQVDDIDHLGNRRLRTIDELACEELRKGFLKLRRTVQERMSLKEPAQLERVAELVNSKSISSAIEYFFGRGELSQVVDQTNPLAQLTHERRLSALGPGGLNRKRAGFEVRDVHISHYGRICPVETPEGTNIGLIASLSTYSTVDAYGFLITPYRKVAGGKVNGEHVFLRADEEMLSVLAPPESVNPKTGRLAGDLVLARVRGEVQQVPAKEVQYVDISPKQTVGVSAALIPFLEHDDANRALMGSNMQRQAVPLVKCERAIVATGVEGAVAENSGMVVRADRGGTVTFVDAQRIVIDGTDEYVLRKFQGLNERTCLNQKPVVGMGQRVKQGQIIADGPACAEGELALGRNVLVGFVTFDGYNFEDAILISQRLVKDDVFTSIHIDEFEVEIRETKLGREEFTRDIPNVSEKALRNLDEHGVVRTGTRVGPNDILVGKVSPKSKVELTPEEKLLHAIFGRAGEDVKNDSLEMPAGSEGIVIDTKQFSRRMHATEEQKRRLAQDIKEYEQACNAKVMGVFKQMCEDTEQVTGQIMINPEDRQKVGKSDSLAVIMEQVAEFGRQVESGQLTWIKPAGKRDEAQKVINRYWPRVAEILEERERKTGHMKRGDELPPGVLEMVKVYVATKRQLAEGDKMAGRHGNKGVIAKILPEEDMPFLEDGTPVDVLVNPLGVPSRMNVGQILETHLAWAAAVLGFRAVTPVFDGAKEKEIFALIKEANKHVRNRTLGDKATLPLGQIPSLEDAKQTLKELQDLKLKREHKESSLSDEDKTREARIKDALRAKYYAAALTSYAFVVTEGKEDPLTDTELEYLEDALILQYPDRERDSHFPRFNRKIERENAPIKVEEDPRLKRLFDECRAIIGDPYSPRWRSSSAGRAGVPHKQGVYFFRHCRTRMVNQGYIGKASKLYNRLGDHFSGNVYADSLLERLAEEDVHEAQRRDAYYQSFDAIKPAGATRELLVEMPASGKLTLYDGRTGEPFDQPVTVGYLYMVKLHHLVDDKIHARATGPYSLITQQPLGGKARTGGQRFGEMEVWGLEAYGASHILQELLTVKSDDVEGRTKIYESMVKGTNTLEAGTPVSFDVLCNEIRGLGLNILLEKKKVG